MQAIEIRQRKDRLQAQRRTIETSWDIIERFCAPYRGEFFREQQSEHEIDWRRREVYDTTSIMAVQHLAAALHGGMTNPAMRWYDLRFRDKAMNEVYEARVWLEECSTLTYQALLESNFNLEINESYLDLTSYGTACIVEEPINDEVWEGLDFSATPIKECFFETDHKDQIYRFYRRLLWSPVQIMDKFGRDKTPSDIIEAADGVSGIDTEEELIFCIYPREDKKNKDTSKRLAPQERPYGFKYVRHKDATQIGDEGGYYEMPCFVPRWRKTSESMWGNSPAMIALADTLTLNQLVELDLRSREKVIDPATLIEERGAFGDLDLEPGGVTVMRDIEKIKPYESGAKFDAVNDTMNRLQEQIKEIFFLDRLDLKTSPQMTATEVMERTERMHRMLGPTVGRLQTDMLDPLIERTFNIMLRAGQLPEMPEVVAANQASLDIQYMGSLARAQKFDQVATLDKFINGVLNLSQIKPEVLDKVDFDKYVDLQLEYNNIPTDLLLPEEVVAGIRQQRAQMQQMQQMAQMAQQGGEAMGALGEGLQSIQGGKDEGAAAG